MLHFFLMEKGGKTKEVVVDITKKQTLKQSTPPEWYGCGVVQIYDEVSGYEFYDSLSFDEAEKFLRRFSSMDVWEKIIFIGYYDKVCGSVMEALRKSYAYDLYLVGKDYHTKIY